MIFRNMKNNILFLFLVLVLASCWAPRCPINSCHVKFEHVHGDYVSGVFSGKHILYPPKIHTPWDGGRGEASPDTELKTSPGGGKRKKLRKKFPWERW